MNDIHADVLIIGGGLTGLTLAYFLKEQNLSVKILEARERLGGRIHTVYAESGAPIEMGATWLGKQHSFLLELLEDLGLEIFEQTLGERAIYEPISTSPPQVVSLPPNHDPSFRIKGGSSLLIETLAAKLSADQIHTGKIVQRIEEQEDVIKVVCEDQHFFSKQVISTLPPRLFSANIQCQPALPHSFTEIADETHTWMGESIKVGLRFDKAFWEKGKSSATIFSSVGPIPEMYDHSDAEGEFHALKGFFNGSYHSVSKEERLKMVLQQLGKYYGNKVKDYSSYEELVWQQEAFTYAPYMNHVLPHQHNGHAIYQEAYMEGKLWIAGTETATAFPGYMEGAIRSARYQAEKIINP
ncbi:MAG: NAD(P)/FAD-dependent oxidoreductase [Bacteroidota bacterium]